MAGCFCLSSISDFGDSSCHGSETAETFIHQLFALVSIQFLYGLHDWCLFFLIFYCPSIDKLVRIQKIDCSLWDHFFTGRRRFNDHCIASSTGSSVKWRSIESNHYVENRSDFLSGSDHEKHDWCL